MKAEEFMNITKESMPNSVWRYASPPKFSFIKSDSAKIPGFRKAGNQVPVNVHIAKSDDFYSVMYLDDEKWTMEYVGEMSVASMVVNCESLEIARQRLGEEIRKKILQAKIDHDNFLSKVSIHLTVLEQNEMGD